METLAIVAICALLAVPAIRAALAQAKALRDAEDAYRAALEVLGTDSENNSLRQDALTKGRHFAELARKKAGSNGVAIFDEVAITNDLTARLGSKSGTEMTVPCPECAEQIQPRARRCRFCGVQLQAEATAA